MRILNALLLVPLMLVLNGCLSLWDLDAVTPEEDEPKHVAEPAAPKKDFFGAAVNSAMAAADGAQTAKSPEAWKAVAELWEQAIESMKAVPSDDKNYSVAQQKAKEYQTNLDYARQSSGLTAVPYTVIEVAGSDMGRKKAEAYIAAPTAVTREQRAETTIKAARELLQQQGADVISVYLEPDPAQWGHGQAVAFSRYAPDGKGFGENNWTWEVKARVCKVVCGRYGIAT